MKELQTLTIAAALLLPLSASASLRPFTVQTAAATGWGDYYARIPTNYGYELGRARGQLFVRLDFPKTNCHAADARAEEEECEDEKLAIDSMDQVWDVARRSVKPVEFGAVSQRFLAFSAEGRTFYDAHEAAEPVGFFTQGACAMVRRIEVFPQSLALGIFSFHEEVDETPQNTYGPSGFEPAGQTCWSLQRYQNRIRAVDVRTGHPARLTDFFPESSLLEALKTDAAVQQPPDIYQNRGQRETELDGLKTLDALVDYLARKGLGTARADAIRGMLERFVLMGFNRKTGRLDARLVLEAQKTGEVELRDRPVFVQIGLSLKPKDSLLETLRHETVAHKALYLNGRRSAILRNGGRWSS